MYSKYKYSKMELHRNTIVVKTKVLRSTRVFRAEVHENTSVIRAEVYERVALSIAKEGHRGGGTPTRRSDCHGRARRGSVPAPTSSDRPGHARGRGMTPPRRHSGRAWPKMTRYGHRGSFLLLWPSQSLAGVGVRRGGGG